MDVVYKGAHVLNRVFSLIKDFTLNDKIFSWPPQTLHWLIIMFLYVSKTVSFGQDASNTAIATTMTDLCYHYVMHAVYTP